MYIPPQFALEDKEALDLIRRFPLGTLVAAGPDGLDAAHIPFVLSDGDGRLTLSCHVARPNPLGSRGVDGTPALAIFRPADGYVTPSLYPSKQEHGKVVPTWNYVAVHVHGSLRFTNDGGWLERHLQALTTQMEAGRAQPWAMSDAPEAYIAQMKRVIIGIEMAVTRIEGKAKVIQHRPEGDKRSVHDSLVSSGDKGDRLMASYVDKALKA